MNEQIKKMLFLYIRQYGAGCSIGQEWLPFCSTILKKNPNIDLKEEYLLWQNLINENQTSIDQEQLSKYLQLQNINLDAIHKFFDEKYLPFDESKVKSKEEEALVWVGNIILQKKNGISTIIGLPKSGKTIVERECIISQLPESVSLGMKLLFQSVKCPLYKYILVFDTEQSGSDLKSNIQSINKKLGVNKLPTQVVIYSIADKTVIERKQFIEEVLRLYAGQIHFVYIDGIADLLYSVNDEIESNKLVEELCQKARIYNIHICVILHENKGGSNGRGHIGSSLERKSECIIECKNRQDKYFEFTTTINRNGKKIEPVYYKLNPTYLYAEKLEQDELRQIKKENTFQVKILSKEDKEVIKRLLPNEGLLLGEYSEEVKSRFNISGDMAKSWIRQISKEGKYIHQKKIKGKYFQVNNEQSKGVSGKVVGEGGIYIPPHHHQPDHTQYLHPESDEWTLLPINHYEESNNDEN